MPNGSRTFSIAVSLPASPVASIVTASVATSTTLALKSWTVSSTCPRVCGSVLTLISMSSRSTAVVESSSTILRTLTSLLSCLVTCSRGSSSTLTTIVMREISVVSVGPTASESMLKPRRMNRLETRASTPGVFSTKTDKVWEVMVSLPVRLDEWRGSREHMRKSAPGHGSRAVGGASKVLVVEVGSQVTGDLDRVVARAGVDHGPDHRVALDDEVHHDGTVGDRHGLLDRRVQVVLGLAAQADAAVRLGELEEVGDASRTDLLRPGVEVGVGVTAFVQQRLPLAHHPERGVVDDRDLDRDALDRAGRELLVGHLEATVAVDRPHHGVREADLRTHRRRQRVAHRACATGVEPLARTLEVDVVRSPHLVLADARRVGRLRPGDRADPLDDGLRGEPLVRLVVADGILRLDAQNLG